MERRGQKEAGMKKEELRQRREKKPKEGGSTKIQSG